jgi:uncharacterized membrane protein YdjX (TVP38/TMEM64 family)
MELVLTTPKGIKEKVVTKKIAREKYKNFSKQFETYIKWFIPLSFLISPFLFFLLTFIAFMRYLKFKNFFFESAQKTDTIKLY